MLRAKKYGIFKIKKGCDCMLATNAQHVIEPTDATKLEFYRLIGEGYKAMQDANQYVPANILMVAYPIGPDYLINTKCIAGIVKANYEDKEFKIESGTGFTVAKTTDYETNWKEAINKESGFVYQLLTSGSYTGAGSTETRKKIRLKWDSKMFKINENDDHYKEVKDDTSKYYTMSEGSIDWQVMEIEVLPYASIKFVFFRNDEFMTKIGSMSKTDFENSVKAEVIP